MLDRKLFQKKFDQKRKPFLKRLDRKPFQKRFDRKRRDSVIKQHNDCYSHLNLRTLPPFPIRRDHKPFQKRFDRKRRDGVINRRNGCGTTVAFNRATIAGSVFLPMCLPQFLIKSPEECVKGIFGDSSACGKRMSPAASSEFRGY